MARKKPQLVSLYEQLKNVKTIKNLYIDKTSNEQDIDNIVISDGMLLSGSFEYENLKYTFFDRCSKDFGLHRLTVSFSFAVSESKINDVNSILDEFNLFKVGLKAIVNKRNQGKISVLFNVECISNGDATVVDVNSIGLYIKMLSTVPAITVKELNKLLGD